MPFLDTTRQRTSIAESRAIDALGEEIRGCQACTFCFNGNGPVLPSGPTPNDIMVLSDSPTRSDDRLGAISFKGEPGILLRRLLARVDLDLDRLFFANVVSCWPETSIPDRNILACTPNLRRLVKMCEPKVVLALGAIAFKVTADSRRRTLRNDHGVPYQARAGIFIDRWIFPTFHPGAVQHAKTNAMETMISADIAEFGRFYREQIRGEGR